MWSNCYDHLVRQGWKIDLEILHGQRETPQRGIMQGNDCVLANKEKIQEAKRLKLQVRREREKQRRSDDNDSLHQLT
jgi:hypothetical protein